MPIFEYVIEGANGKPESGTIEAISKVVAIRKIKNSGKTLYLISELDPRLADVHRRVQRLKRIISEPTVHITPTQARRRSILPYVILIIMALGLLLGVFLLVS